MVEPKLKYCGVRDALNKDGINEIHLECRFDDGQKFAAVIIEGGFENLAHFIADYLNSESFYNKQYFQGVHANKGMEPDLKPATSNA